MGETRAFLASIGLPPGDLHELPDSRLRFPDGAQYRIEIPTMRHGRDDLLRISIAPYTGRADVDRLLEALPHVL